MMETEKNGNILMQRYEIGKLLGQGTFAKVYHARNIETSQSVAIKVIDKDKIFKVGLMEQIKREISVMKLVRHPNIVQLYEVMATKSKIYFVLEYVKGGELFNKIAKGKLREDAARKYFQQLVSAVDFCHSRGVYHRDLKPENLLVDENGNLKISDFGLSALTESRRQDGLLHTTCGTPAYVAPEVISRKGYDGAKVDTWSCGVILFVLMAGYLPFQDSNLMEMYRKIGKADFKCPPWFPSDVRKLVSRILDPNPRTRMPITKIVECFWFKKGIDSKLIRKNIEIKGKVSALTNVKQDVAKVTNLNAFDIISLSEGFNLSGLFDESDKRKEARFTSSQSASTIISKLEDVATSSKLTVKKKEGGVLKMEGENEGRKGVLSIDAEIFEVTPSFHLVEIKKNNGDTIEYENLFKQDMKPALKDIVWAWQGERQDQ
ncbi:CBL-interacting protein kinase 18 [Miscanthus floridulus]|uniref:CBL-interacting protein kinase 18 n=1 Tax=Miscanthus floridulus TaxID=154761 RepID=UPI003457F4F8